MAARSPLLQLGFILLCGREEVGLHEVDLLALVAVLHRRNRRRPIVT
jgi:hypothetical protein